MDAWKPTLRYTSCLGIAGRRREMAEVRSLLDLAADGRGGVLAVSGPPGSGRTELAAAAAREAASRGFEVLRTVAVRGQPGQLAWARLLADAGVADDLAARALGDMGPQARDSVARALAAGTGGCWSSMTPTERARVNVTRTLRATIDRIMMAAPIAGAHLTSSIQTGTMCCDQPAPGGPDRWLT